MAMSLHAQVAVAFLSAGSVTSSMTVGTTVMREDVVRKCAFRDGLIGEKMKWKSRLDIKTTL